MKLHLGCGPHSLKGWLNIDNQPYAGVDQVLDVAQGLPFENVAFIFAEHFIEHLDYREALGLMRECRRVLRDDGVLRLSTPNLDWVWASHYRRAPVGDDAIAGCFALNRAFRGWGHQFLYNVTTLRASLLDAGFADVVCVEYGESAHPELRGLERHERNPDFDGLSHILIVEASGRGASTSETLANWRADYLRDVDVR